MSSLPVDWRLPGGWKMMPLGEIATLQRGFDLPIQDRQEGSVKIFAANGPVDTHNIHQVRGPGVVTGRSGSIGKVHYVDEDFWPLNTALWVKDFHGNDPKWVARALTWMNLEQYTRGVGVPTLNRNLVHEAIIPLPPLAEQKRIAGILDQADTLRRLRARALEKLNTLGQAIFKEMFGAPSQCLGRYLRRLVGDVIAGFETGKNLAEDPDGGRQGAIRVLKISAVTSGVFKPHESKALPSDYEPPASHFVKTGDLLFSRANTAQLIGATALVDDTPGNLVLPDKLWRFLWRDDSPVTPVFMHALFSSSAFRDEISKRATGTSGSMKNIGQSKVLEIPFDCPPLDEQLEFGARMKELNSAIASAKDSINTIDSLFASLQHRAFRGEL